MIYLLQGFTMGIASMAPIGAQNLFVMNSALTNALRRACLNALIVVFFDVTLAWGCFFGVGAIIETSRLLRMAVLLIGGIVVVRMGYALLKTEKAEAVLAGERTSLKNTVCRACVVTWFNPQAVIDCSMIFGAFRASLGEADGLRFIIGVTCASFCWFVGLTSVMSLIGSRLNAGVLKALNKVCGTVMIFYGCRLFLDFLRVAGITGVV